MFYKNSCADCDNPNCLFSNVAEDDLNDFCSSFIPQKNNITLNQENWPEKGGKIKDEVLLDKKSETWKINTKK